MSPDPTATAPDDGLEPVVEDLGAYIMAGRVKSSAQAIDDAVEAERLGFRRAWLSERYDLKEAGVLLGAMGARTSRIGLATGALIPSARPPIVTAALGSTFHSACGPRLVLGLGRSTPDYLDASGIRPLTYAAFLDHARILKRLWAGERVTYDGPAGRWDGIELADTFPGPAPEVWGVVLGGPRASRAVADPVFDGVLLAPFFTPEAVADTVGWIHDECERIGRDPATLRICHPVVTAPDLDEAETRAQLQGRLVTYLHEPMIGELYVDRNHWDPGILRALREHELFRDLDGPSVDHAFHRDELAGPAALIPDAWMDDTAAFGSVERCVALLARFKDAGVDELSTYGSTPGQNASLVRAWRSRGA